MTQKAILDCVASNGEHVLAISTGTDIATHTGTQAIDLNGIVSGLDLTLLAPFDCVVKGLRTYDNAILFESTVPVLLANGEVHDKVCFECIHILDSDKAKYNLRIGTTFKQGEPCYCEGVKGLGSGYHIHLAQGIGKAMNTAPSRLTGGTYTFNGKTYNQYRINCSGEEVAPNDFFFLAKDMTIRLDKYLSDSAKAYQWKFDDGKELEMEKKKFKDGYQVIEYNSQKVHVVKARPNWKLGHQINSGSIPNNLNPLSEMVGREEDKVQARINCNYFINNSNNAEHGTLLGRAQGWDECGKLIDNRPEDDELWLDAVVTNKGELLCDYMHSWDYEKKDVQVGFSPAVIFMWDGKKRQTYSTNAGISKVGTRNSQTLFLEDEDGIHYFAVCEAGLNAHDCFNLFSQYNITKGVMLDSGGSSEMVVAGEIVTRNSYERPLPDCLYFYTTDEEQPTEPEKPNTITQEEHDRLLKEAVDKAVELGKKEAHEADKALIEQLQAKVKADFDEALKQFKQEN